MMKIAKNDPSDTIYYADTMLLYSALYNDDVIAVLSLPAEISSDAMVISLVQHGKRV